MKWANQDNAAEWAADVAAAAMFAAAVAFAAGAARLSTGPTIFAAAVASLVIYGVLRSVSVGERSYALPAFELAPLELADDELLLDDALGNVEPDGGVVRLFDPRQMPAAGDSSSSVHRDASEALTKALDELRRSLR